MSEEHMASRDLSHAAGGVMEWRPIDTAPRDGHWLILQNDDGHITIGRFEPKAYRIGEQLITYEWRVLEWGASEPGDRELPEDDLWNHWATGHAWAWCPLPAYPTSHTPPQPERGYSGGSQNAS